MRPSVKYVTILMSAACLLLTAGVVASAAGRGAGPTNAGPESSAAPPGGQVAVAPPAVPAAATTPIVPAYQPAPAQAIYVPITPCRMIDTRSAGGRLQAGTTRNFKVRGSTGFAAQGGNPAGCGIPATATAVTVSVSSTNMAGTGYFRVWPYGQSEPNATIAHYQLGPITTTGGTMTLGSGAWDITMKAYDAGASPVVDVTGYYDTQIHLIILADGTVWYGTAHLLTITHPGTGSYVLTFDRTLDGCNVLATNNGDTNVNVAPTWGGATVNVHTYRLSSGSYSAADASFQVYASC